MRAIVFSRPREFSVTEVPEPAPGPRDAIVRVEAVGICGTDVHVLDGEFAPTVFPIVPGHEASGVVVNVGDEVGNVAPGDPVSLDPSFYCGECSYAWSDAATCARTGTAPGWHDRTALPPSSSAGQPRTCIVFPILLILLWRR